MAEEKTHENKINADNNDWRGQMHKVLEKIGIGRMSSTVYDTAWVARLTTSGDSMGIQALKWLKEQQLPDGSWGAREIRYHHDRLVCTLAAMTALARHGQVKNASWWRRAQLALETFTKGLGADPAGETVGFEMIVPMLLTEASQLGIIRRQPDNILGQLVPQRAAKIAALPQGIINRSVTVAHSAEMAGPDGIHLLDVPNLQEANGSVAHSPSATAYFALYVRPQDPAAIAYLQRYLVNGSVPNVAPFDVFERAWVLWNVALAGMLDDEILALCKPHLDALEQAWVAGKGVGFASGYTPKDGDDTGFVHEVLTRFGRTADLAGLLSYEMDDHFRCFALESNASLSANVHALGALRHAGFDVQHPTAQKVLRFLQARQTLQLFWFDKWHASPYYTTAHMLIAGAGYVNHMLQDAIYWMLETQNPDGSWGYYVSTAEETAYCLQSLVMCKRHGYKIPSDVLKRGANWLAQHAEPPYPPLWIGKCLYCPVWVVRSTILGALIMVNQE